MESCSLPAIQPGLPEARIDLGALRRNWRILASLARKAPPLAVVKADAYSHGLAPVALALLDEGCRFFATGSVAEGVFLRTVLAGKTQEAPTIVPLLGIMGEDDAQNAVRHGLLPLVHAQWQLPLLLGAHTGPSPLPVALKIETGMARLGVGPNEGGAMLAALQAAEGLKPVLAVSHFASADEVDGAASVAVQMGRFLPLYTAARAAWPDIIPSIANSAAYLLQDEMLPHIPSHVARPGYALYGGNPLADTPYHERGACFAPVMSVVAPVLAVRDLAPGMSVSYGRTYTAERPMRVAVVGAGYSDGFSRGLSGRGRVCIRGVSCPIIGRVCMQMHVVDATALPDAAPGDEAYLLGGHGAGAVPMTDLAALWGTIPYETFCILGKNRRVYFG